jgi:hypothetical protein
MFSLNPTLVSLYLQQDATVTVGHNLDMSTTSLMLEDFLRQHPERYSQVIELLDNICNSIHSPTPTYPDVVSPIVQPQAPHPPDSTIVELCYGLLIQVLKEDVEEAATWAQQAVFCSPTNTIQYNPWVY